MKESTTILRMREMGGKRMRRDIKARAVKMRLILRMQQGSPPFF